MGLDMYLYTYPEEQEENYKKIFELSNEESNKLWDETYEIGYWRKCNFLHKFLCTNGQLIENEILYIIPRATLYDFLEKAVKVVKKHSTKFSQNTLPTCAGFFYGSTEYDDYYYEWVLEEISKVAEILKNYDDEKFLYYASW